MMFALLNDRSQLIDLFTENMLAYIITKFNYIMLWTN